MKFVLVVYLFCVFLVNCSTTQSTNIFYQVLSPKSSKRSQMGKINGLKVFKYIINLEISQEYEDAIYEYDAYPDELSLGHQMDLGRMIDNYDIPEDCFEEVISVYEYYDTDEPEQNQEKNYKNNFQVHDLGEEEFLKVEQIVDENRDVQSVIVKQQESGQIQNNQVNEKKGKQKKKQGRMNLRKKQKK